MSSMRTSPQQRNPWLLQWRWQWQWHWQYLFLAALSLTLPASAPPTRVQAYANSSPLQEHRQAAEQQNEVFQQLTTELEAQDSQHQELMHQYHQLSQQYHCSDHQRNGTVLLQPLWLQTYYIDFYTSALVVLVVTVLLMITQLSQQIISPFMLWRQRQKSMMCIPFIEEDLSSTSKQFFPVGSRVSTKLGDGLIRSYDADADTYTVEMDASGALATIVATQILTPRVEEIWIYPIKSCGGIRLGSSRVLARGFQYDRRWMIVDSKHRFVTQRKCPKLARLRPQLPLSDQQGIFLNADEMETLYVPEQTNTPENRLVVKIWKDHVAAVDQGDQAAKWLQKYLGKEAEGCRLVKVSNEAIRVVDPAYASGYQTGFADGFPYLVLSKKSVEALNQHLENAIDIRRFRPNIVVINCPAFAEDRWKTLDVGGIRMRNVKLCSRCKIPTIDPNTGVFDPNEAVATVLQHQRSGRIMGLSKKSERKTFMGFNAVADSNGSLSIGDTIRVLSLHKICPE